MTHNSYKFEVLINGSPVAEYSHESDTYIEGREGSEFTLRFKNTGSKRVLVVMSVDGLSVMDGETASYSSNGYIVDPYGSIKIPGWRLSDEEVAKFYFATKKDSYAKSKNKDLDVGVVGCVVFEEDTPEYERFIKEYIIEKEKCVPCPCPHVHPYDPCPWTPYPNPVWCGDNTFNLTTSATNTGAVAELNVSAQNSSKQLSVEPTAQVFTAQNLGAGFGEATDHHVEAVSFKRENSPSATMSIYYDDRKGLQAKGVYLGHSHKADAFPGQFCKPPKGWGN